MNESIKQYDAAKVQIAVERPPLDPAGFMAWAQKYGSMIARTYFKNHGRGDNVEIHISVEQLAAFLAFAFEMGVKAERGGIDVVGRVGAKQPVVLVREDCVNLDGAG